MKFITFSVITLLLSFKVLATEYKEYEIRVLFVFQEAEIDSNDDAFEQANDYLKFANRIFFEQKTNTRLVLAGAETSKLENLEITKLRVSGTYQFSDGISDDNIVEKDLELIISGKQGDIQKLRKKYRADIVYIQSPYGKFSKISGRAGGIAPSSDRSYVVLDSLNYRDSYITFVHETGHIFGARHYDGVCSGEGLATIMTSPEMLCFDDVRVPILSETHKSFLGIDLGPKVSGLKSTVQIFRDNAKRVSQLFENLD